MAGESEDETGATRHGDGSKREHAVHAAVAHWSARDDYLARYDALLLEYIAQVCRRDERAAQEIVRRLVDGVSLWRVSSEGCHQDWRGACHACCGAEHHLASELADEVLELLELDSDAGSALRFLRETCERHAREDGTA